MLSRLISWQQKWATKKVLAFFAISYAVFPVFLLPLILPEGKPLDLHLYYSAVDAYNLIASYGEYNRMRYVVGSATIDMIYPLFYATFLGLVLRFFIGRITQLHNRWRYFSLSPYVIMLIDFCENIAIITLLLTYPDRNDSLAQLASTLTFTKWILFIIVSTLLLYFPIRYFRQTKQLV